MQNLKKKRNQNKCNPKYKTIKWNDIKIGDVFKDGSKITSIHEHYTEECYKLYYGNFLKKDSCILSSSHLLLCDISNLNNECKQWVIDNFKDYKIPIEYDRVVNENFEPMYDIPVMESAENSFVNDNECWLNVKTIYLLVSNFKQKIYCNNNLISDIFFEGNKEVFCVVTDTHRYETHGLIHHNSVTLRNIIFHCLTHGEKISIALIDLKFTEFTYFKGMKNVVAVANTVQEAVEILRIAREVMYKRNQEMAKIGINDIADFKPQKPTDEVVVAGRKLNDNDQIEIRLPNGEEKTVTVKELEQYL